MVVLQGINAYTLVKNDEYALLQRAPSKLLERLPDSPLSAREKIGLLLSLFKDHSFIRPLIVQQINTFGFDTKDRALLACELIVLADKTLKAFSSKAEPSPQTDDMFLEESAAEEKVERDSKDAVTERALKIHPVQNGYLLYLVRYIKGEIDVDQESKKARDIVFNNVSYSCLSKLGIGYICDADRLVK